MANIGEPTGLILKWWPFLTGSLLALKPYPPVRMAPELEIGCDNSPLTTRFRTKILVYTLALTFTNSFIQDLLALWLIETGENHQHLVGS